MKKMLLSLVAIAALAGCSTSAEDLQSVNAGHKKSVEDTPTFSPLLSGGVKLPKVDETYSLPKVANRIEQTVDIRPPSSPLALLKNSLTRFDGERALIVFSDQESEIYNLQQVARLFKEDGVESQINGAVLTTDWTTTGRNDDKDNTEIKYQVEQVYARKASALAMSVVDMRRDGIIFTPTTVEKQRYTSDRLNRIISTLSAEYNKQLKELSSNAEDAH